MLRHHAPHAVVLHHPTHKHADFIMVRCGVVWCLITSTLYVFALGRVCGGGGVLHSVLSLVGQIHGPLLTDGCMGGCFGGSHRARAAERMMLPAQHTLTYLRTSFQRLITS
jgi:hypothetical protein